MVRSFEAFLTVVDFIEFILKSSLWPYKSWCCLGKFLISLWHRYCFKSLRVSVVRLLLCGCRTITVPIIKFCRVTILGPLLCSYRTITMLTNPAGSLLWGHCCVDASHKLQSLSHKFVITLWVDLLCFTVPLSHWTLSSPISHKSKVTLEVDLTYLDVGVCIVERHFITVVHFVNPLHYCCAYFWNIFHHCWGSWWTLFLISPWSHLKLI